MLISGCGDESKQSGTQVQVSEEQKAQLNSKRDMYNARAKEHPRTQKKR